MTNTMNAMMETKKDFILPAMVENECRYGCVGRL